MSVGVKITAESERKVADFFKRAKTRLRAEVVKEVAAAGLVAEGIAGQAAPVGTPESTGIKGYIGGTLRQSIRYTPISGGLGAAVFTNVEYAAAQNFGTAYIAGKHFMEKGFHAGVKRLNQGLR